MAAIHIKMNPRFIQTVKMLEGFHLWSSSFSTFLLKFFFFSELKFFIHFLRKVLDPIFKSFPAKEVQNIFLLKNLTRKRNKKHTWNLLYKFVKLRRKIQHVQKLIRAKTREKLLLKRINKCIFCLTFEKNDFEWL